MIPSKIASVSFDASLLANNASYIFDLQTFNPDKLEVYLEEQNGTRTKLTKTEYTIVEKASHVISQVDSMKLHTRHEITLTANFLVTITDQKFHICREGSYIQDYKQQPLVQNTLERALDIMTLDIQNNKERLDDLTGIIPRNTALQIPQNTADIATLTAQQTTNTGNIATNTSNIATNTGHIATNTSSIATNTGHIATNTSNIGNLTSQQNTNTSNISSLTTQVGENTGHITLAQQDIAALQQQQTTNTGDIGALQTQVGANQSTLGLLNTQVGNNTGNISTNTSDIAALQQQIATGGGGGSSTPDPQTAINTGDITNIKAEQVTQNTNIGNNASAITAIQGEQTTQDTKIANLESQQTINTSNISSNTTGIGTINTQLSNNTNTISGLVTTTQGHTSTLAQIAQEQTNQDASIVANTGAISSNTTDIADLTVKMDKNKPIMISNGLISGFDVTNNGSNFDIGEGKALFIDDTDGIPQNPSIVTFPVQSAVNVPFLAVQKASYVYLHKDGTTTVENTRVDHIRGDKILLFKLRHPDHQNISGIIPEAKQVANIPDLLSFFGALMPPLISGFYISSLGSNQLAHTEGNIYKYNISTDPTSRHQYTFPDSSTGFSFEFRKSDGSSVGVVLTTFPATPFIEGAGGALTPLSSGKMAYYPIYWLKNTDDFLLLLATEEHDASWPESIEEYIRKNKSSLLTLLTDTVLVGVVRWTEGFDFASSFADECRVYNLDETNILHQATTPQSSSGTGIDLQNVTDDDLGKSVIIGKSGSDYNLEFDYPKVKDRTPHHDIITRVLADPDGTLREYTPETKGAIPAPQYVANRRRYPVTYPTAYYSNKGWKFESNKFVHNQKPDGGGVSGVSADNPINKNDLYDRVKSVSSLSKPTLTTSDSFTTIIKKFFDLIGEGDATGVQKIMKLESTPTHQGSSTDLVYTTSILYNESDGEVIPDVIKKQEAHVSLPTTSSSYPEYTLVLILNAVFPEYGFLNESSGTNVLFPNPYVFHLPLDIYLNPDSLVIRSEFYFYIKLAMCLLPNLNFDYNFSINNFITNGLKVGDLLYHDNPAVYGTKWMFREKNNPFHIGDNIEIEFNLHAFFTSNTGVKHSITNIKMKSEFKSQAFIDSTISSALKIFPMFEITSIQNTQTPLDIDIISLSGKPYDLDLGGVTSNNFKLLIAQEFVGIKFNNISIYDYSSIASYVGLTQANKSNFQQSSKYGLSRFPTSGSRYLSPTSSSADAIYTDPDGNMYGAHSMSNKVNYNSLDKTSYMLFDLKSIGAGLDHQRFEVPLTASPDINGHRPHLEAGELLIWIEALNLSSADFGTAANPHDSSVEDWLPWGDPKISKKIPTVSIEEQTGDDPATGHIPAEFLPDEEGFGFYRYKVTLTQAQLSWKLVVRWHSTDINAKAKLASYDMVAWVVNTKHWTD